MDAVWGVSMAGSEAGTWMASRRVQVTIRDDLGKRERGESDRRRRRRGREIDLQEGGLGGVLAGGHNGGHAAIRVSQIGSPSR